MRGLIAVLLALPLLVWAESTPETRMDDVRYIFPWEIDLGPLHFQFLEATSVEDGTKTFCDDCLDGSDPCQQAFVAPFGAYADRINGRWRCGSAIACPSLDACLPTCVNPGNACTTSCNCCQGSCVNFICVLPCVTVGGFCTTGADCCTGICTDGICAVGITCGDIGVTCNICPSMSACNLTSTIPPSTSSTSTTSTTATTTTTGAGTTTTSTTLAFNSFGFVYTNNLVNGSSDVYGAGGQTATTAPATPVLMPVLGHFSHPPPQALRFSCIADQPPNGTDPTCNNSSILCPVWTICLARSDSPLDEVNFTDTLACCTMNSIFQACTASNGTITFQTGDLLTFHAHYTVGGGGGGGTGPTHMRCTQEIGP